jgi:hypothetical protein
MSVFIVPALLASVISVAAKGRLIVRRVNDRRAAAQGATARAAAAATSRSRSIQMRAALQMLAQRFVLKHDELAYEERKSTNDRDRYEGYNYILGIAVEACSPTLGPATSCCPP